MKTLDFVLRGEFITLDKLLKATGLATSGAAAKQWVAAGGVQVDGRDELRKTAKLRPGQVVAVAGSRVRLHAAPTDTVTDADADADADAPPSTD